MRAVFALLFVIALAHQAEAATKLAVGRTERYRLPNGLEVILQQDRRQPRVAVVMIYDVGHRDELDVLVGVERLLGRAVASPTATNKADADRVAGRKFGRTACQNERRRHKAGRGRA